MCEENAGDSEQVIGVFDGARLPLTFADWTGVTDCSGDPDSGDIDTAEIEYIGKKTATWRDDAPQTTWRTRTR